MTDQIIEMRLCEAHRLVLHPDQLYRFTVAPGCRQCEAEAGMATRPDPAPGDAAVVVHGVASAGDGASIHAMTLWIRAPSLYQRSSAPVPKGLHADEPKSRGLVALTQMTGAALARRLDAQGAYADLLLRKFADCPVALPLTSRADYVPLLGLLASEIDGADLPAPERCTPDPRIQLDLFVRPVKPV